MVPRLSHHALEKWAQIGVMWPVLLNRIYVCPTCHALATFGSGCKSCGSADLAVQQHIRHFACDYVGPAKHSDSSGHVACPACQAEDLMENADYEYVAAAYDCAHCGHSDTELILVGSCLHCAARFPVSDAVEVPLIGYQTNRLDLQAQLDSI
jgi:hypothetical protein